MTAGQLPFAVATTIFILIAIQLEEHDLTQLFGDAYRAYKKRVSMLLPFPRRRALRPGALRLVRPAVAVRTPSPKPAR